MIAGVAFAAALSIASSALAADESLSSLEARAKRGDYEAVVDALGDAQNAGKIELLARTLVHLGRYDEAKAAAQKLARADGGQRSAVVLAWVEARTGKRKAAIARLKKYVLRHPRDFEARIRLAEARMETGTPRRSLSEADAIADFWQEGEVTEADDLIWLGRGLHLTEYFQNANEIFEEALAADPEHLEGRLMYAQLFLEKENETEAGKLVAEVLESNPRHPLALALTARMDASSDNDPVKALENVGKALAVNPKFVPALQVKAHVLVETEQFAEAQKVLDEALAIDATNAKTLAMWAACRFLLEDDKGFRKGMKRVARVHSRYAEGWHIVAEYAVRQHRYADAVKLEKKALKLDPEYAPSWVGLGLGYSRVGEDEKANEALQTAFELDGFNVRAFNLTDQFYDGPVKRMVWWDAGPFRVRSHKAEAERLRPVVGPFLTEAYDVHRKNYGFTPTKPLNIELFRDRQTFAIRSTGYPGLPAHGICFGHVVTAMSPSLGDFNWAMVLWHELAHVWHIQMSKSRVPRWFTEGLAEHETTLRRPEWKREMDAQLWAAHRADSLRGIATFNTMFTTAKSLDEIVLAYYYASRVVRFIDQKWGFEVFPKMLRAWGRLKTTDEVFATVLGVDLATFDARMKSWLDDELLVRFATQWTPDEAGTEDPHDVAWREANAAIKGSDPKTAAEKLDTILADGKDSVELRLLRAMTAVDRGQWATARTHLEKGLTLDPQDHRLYRLLRKVLEHEDDQDAIYALMKQASLHEESGLALLVDLMERARKRKQTDDLAAFAERALHIAPMAPAVRAWRAFVWMEQGDAKRALVEAATALGLPGGAKSELAKEVQKRAREALGSPSAP